MVDKPPPKAPTASLLHDAALRYLARYATTAGGLLRVLNRRIDRWAMATQPEPDAVSIARDAARQEIANLSSTGLLDDAAFATIRAQRLTRSGKSRRKRGTPLSRPWSESVWRLAPPQRPHELQGSWQV